MYKTLIALTASVILMITLDAMEVKPKSCKCFTVARDLISIEKCFVKAVSRNTSTFNVVVKLNKTFEAPIYVRDLSKVELALIYVKSVFSD